MALLQKKEILRKAIRAMGSAICLSSLVLMTAGCGKVEEPIPVQLSSGHVEELQNGTAGEIEDGSDEAAVRNTETDPENISAGTTKVDAGDDMNESEKDSSENNAAQKAIQTDEERDANEVNKEPAGQDDSPDENVQRTEDAQLQSLGSAELEGNVRSIGADSFVVARNEVWSEGDALYAVGAAPGYEKEEDLITVYVNQNCVWEFKTVKNGGINPEDVSAREGSFADLQDGISTICKGSWQDDGSFFADSIVMMIFV